LVLLALAYWLFLPLGAERYFGPSPAQHQPPYRVPAETRELHDRLLVADLHGDTLLWSRDLLERSERGHLDIPRMVEGGIGLQTLMAVVDGPFDATRDHIDEGLDQVFFLALLDRWPLSTLPSHKERALWMAERVRDAEDQSEGKFALLESQGDLASFLARRERSRDVTAAVLGIEGAHPTEWNVANLDVLCDAGYRLIELAHYTDTPLAGSSSGMAQGGLTDLGREFVRRMEELGITVDVAHASSRAIHDVLDIATRPVFASHVGVRSTCDRTRNLDDTIVDRIADNGGVIGIGFFPDVICEPNLSGVVRAVRWIVDRVGAEHVAFGSGFDAPVEMPIDATGMVLLTDALLGEGFTEDQIEKIVGGNVIRVLETNLPE